MPSSRTMAVHASCLSRSHRGMRLPANRAIAAAGRWRRGCRCAGGGSLVSLGRPLARRNSSTNCPISHSPSPRRLIRGAVRDGGGPGCGSSPRSSRLAPDGHLDRLEVAGPIQDGVVAASLTAKSRSSTTSAEMVASGSCCKLVRTACRSPARQVGEPAKETSIYCPAPALRPSCPGGGSCRPG